MHRADRRLPWKIAMLMAIIAPVLLGVWQLQRLRWKVQTIERVSRRLADTPAPSPGPLLWSNINAVSDEYRRVRIAGRFLNDEESLVQAVTVHGPGFWLLTPLKTDTGFIVLINRGFMPTDHAGVTDRAASAINSETVVVGLLRLSEPSGAFLRDNDPAAGRWYSRDVAAIALAHHLQDVAPYFIDADATPNAGGLPIGGLTVVTFSNHHLQYALTWFGLALVAAIAAVRFSRDDAM